MPIYEFSCNHCETEFEVLIRADETPHCPDCGDMKLEKKFSVPAAAHTNGSSQLPVCQPPTQQGCGLPQCGMGGCQME